MQTLDETLERIEELRKSYSGIRIIQKEVGHWESLWDYERQTVWVVDKPLITEVDDEGKRRAEEELKQLASSTGYFSARYIISRIIGKRIRNTLIPDSKIEINFEKWIDEMREKIGDPYIGDDEKAEVVRDAVRLHFEIKNNSTSLNPRLDVQKRLEELMSDVYSCSRDRRVRRITGKFLGYSDARIWASENQIPAFILAVAGVAGVTGLSYLVYNYLNR